MHCTTISHHGYLSVKHAIWGQSAAVIAQLVQYLLKNRWELFYFFKLYATKLRRRKQRSFHGQHPSEAKMFKAHYLHKSNMEGTILKNCANDLFYATSVQQGELFTREDL